MISIKGVRIDYCKIYVYNLMSNRYSGGTMATKLTLYMEESLLEKAKWYSENKGQSLSKMVSGYFEALTSAPTDATSVSERVRSLRGVVRLDGDAKAAYTDYLEEKYLP
jgi:hypothetical protein